MILSMTSACVMQAMILRRGNAALRDLVFEHAGQEFGPSGAFALASIIIHNVVRRPRGQRRLRHRAVGCSLDRRHAVFRAVFGRFGLRHKRTQCATQPAARGEAAVEASQMRAGGGMSVVSRRKKSTGAKLMWVWRLRQVLGLCLIQRRSH